MDDKIWLSSPHMGGNEMQYVQEAFVTNWVAPLGPNVTGFEVDLKLYLNADSNVVALCSGTAAIHLALILLGVSPGDEVICQSMTFSASANPIAYLGATPVFIDSEPDTWNMSPEFLEMAIRDRISKGRKPKAIIPVHLYGMPAKMSDIMAIAEKYGIPVLEDAAEALGSEINGKHCGTFGEMACLSFNGNKIITTSGGGALVAKEKRNTDRAIFLATQARDTAPHYQHSQIGYNYRMSNICAGIGRGQMEVLDRHIALRRANFEFYKKAFLGVSSISFLEEPKGYFSNRWLSAILVNPENGITRETIRLALEAENIESRPLWKPMHLQPVFSSSPFYGGKMSEELFNNGLCLPSGSNLKEEELERTVNVILRVFQKAEV
ncbi:MAG: aminotransferase class I/II-fold pyridoxal phosphate-dependent enzyme [Daejeonella sp.]|uniref:DegT/DnrJ/EryC1/StrS family aminotransferase n=1 Tax=Daejeonella sp. TaxID=2805397 RepID=UPI0027348755|nr:aminotransferase class I/II-fold pyridoxal phosphate-dependent enzyme [Daejeonella sp.]MDP3467503.1 aminotransferase class I/II-fold pyridoxal phosphate-dependent enzyme [Daejeonella sp.]